MSLVEKLINEFEMLSDAHKAEVFDFVEFLKMREDKKIEDMMDDIIDTNLEALEALAK
jgi:hypothetical protein